MNIEQEISGLRQLIEFYTGFFAKTPEDKLNWRPQVCESGDATSVMDITKHLVSSEFMMRQLFETGTTPAPPEGAGDGNWASSDAFAASDPTGLSTKEEALKILAELADGTAEVVRNVSEAAWLEEIDAGWMKGPRLLFWRIHLSHWSYHTGQIGYIQRLWGDLGF